LFDHIFNHTIGVRFFCNGHGCANQLTTETLLASQAMPEIFSNKDMELIVVADTSVAGIQFCIASVCNPDNQIGKLQTF